MDSQTLGSTRELVAGCRVGGDGETLEALKGFFGSVLPSLGKRDRRQVVGGLAVALGRGGQARVVEASV